MQPGTTDDCWSSHMFLSRKPIALFTCWPQSFCGGVRTRHLQYSLLRISAHPRAQKNITYHQWCAPPAARALVMRSPYCLPKCMLLDLPHDVIYILARLRLRVHALLRCEIATSHYRYFPGCDRCGANDCDQDEQHAIFHCTYHQAVSLHRRYAHLFSKTGSLDASAF